MKNNKKIILTGIIASPLFCGSCDNENSTQDNDFERIASIANKNSAIPLNTVGLEPNYFKLLTCIVTDIINEPTEAENFSKNPIEYCSKKGIKNITFDLQDPIWQLIVAMGDKDLHNTIKEGNITKYIQLCKEKGLLTNLDKSNFNLYAKAKFNYSKIKEESEGGDDASLVITAVAIIAEAVGITIVAVDAVAIYSTITMFSGATDEPSPDSIGYNLWNIESKTNDIKDFTDEYKQAIVNECYSIIEKYFPEKLQGKEESSIKKYIYDSIRY